MEDNTARKLIERRLELFSQFLAGVLPPGSPIVKQVAKYSVEELMTKLITAQSAGLAPSKMAELIAGSFGIDCSTFAADVWSKYVKWIEHFDQLAKIIAE